MATTILSSFTEVVLADTRLRTGTILLPRLSDIPYRILTFKDVYGTFSNSTLTLSTQQGNTFEDSTTTIALSNNYSYYSLYGASTKWVLMTGTQTQAQTVSTLQVNSLQFGTGTGWIQTPPLQTVVVSANTIFASIVQSPILSSLQLNVSSINGGPIIGTSNLAGLVSTTFLNTALASTVIGLGTVGYVSTATMGAFFSSFSTSYARVFNTSSITASSLTAQLGTVSSLIVGSLQVGGGSGWLQMPPMQTFGLSTNQIYAVNSQTILLSTLGLNVSSINGGPILATSNLAGLVSTTFLNTALASTVIGLGTVGYLSTLPSIGGFVSTANLAGLVSTSFLNTALASTVIGLGTAGYLSTATSPSTISSLFVGAQSTANFIKFWGALGNYNNGVIADMSTGATTRELLFFNASSINNQIRLQTTGDIRFETGVSAPVDFNTQRQVPTATMIIKSSSNIGINTNTPSYTLDVNGSARFQTLMSTPTAYIQALYVGMIFT